MPFVKNTTYPGMAKDIVSLEQSRRSMMIDAKLAAFNKRLEQIQERNRATMMVAQKIGEFGVTVEQHGKELNYLRRGAEATGVQLPKMSVWDYMKTATFGVDKNKLYTGPEGRMYRGRELSWTGAAYNFGDEYGRQMAMEAKRSSLSPTQTFGPPKPNLEVLTPFTQYQSRLPVEDWRKK